MASSCGPAFPATDDARQFWQEKRIKDLDTLRAYSGSVSYLALDCEGQEGCDDGVTSVGLAFLPSTDPPPMSIFASWPWHNVDLDDAVLHYKIRPTTLRIEGRRRSRAAEPFRYGDVDSIAVDELESCIYRYLHVIGPQERLILVAWSIENEMRAVTRLFPGLLSRFDGWIDLARIASYMSGIRTKQKRSLRDTLLTFGFAHDYSVQDFRRAHDPGMDAARAAAALVGLMACPTQQIDIPKWTLNEKAARKQLQKRPPRDKYPYAVRISSTNGLSMPQAIKNPPKLESYVKARFAAPTAVAICPPSRPEKHKTHGWICFDDLSLMERFVELLNGDEIDGIGMHLSICGPLEPAEAATGLTPLSVVIPHRTAQE